MMRSREGAPSLGTLRGLAECALTLKQFYGLERCPDDLGVLADRMHDTGAVGLLQEVGASTSMLKEELLQGHTLLSWADQGLAAFDLTHSLMAALILTDPSEIASEAVKLPFPTFAVRLPDGFWALHGHQGEATCASVVMVHTYRAMTTKSPLPRPLFSFRIIGRNGSTSTWEIREPLPETGRIGDWIADDVPEVEDPAGAVIPPDEHDKCLAVAFRRLLVNLCLYVTAHGRGERLGRRRPARSTRPASAPAPAADLWILGREVKLDRELVASAKAWTDARSGGCEERAAWRLRARFTVRGHWRNVARGPGFSEHVLKWIAPYWKGEGPSFAHVYMPAGDGS